MADSAFGHAAIVASFLTKTMDTTKVSVTETLFSVAASQVCVKDVRPACSQQANASEIAMAAAGPAELVLVDSCTSPDSQQRIVHRQHDVQDQHRDRQLLEREREREREQEHARSSPAPHNASSTTFAHVHCEEKEKKRRRCDRYDSSESSDRSVTSPSFDFNHCHLPTNVSKAIPAVAKAAFMASIQNKLSPQSLLQMG